MKAQSLEEIEQNIKPDPKKHWVIPGTVRAAICTAIIGPDCKEKQIVLACMAISSTAFTKFMGYLPPLMTSNTLFVIDDIFSMSKIIRKILNGHGIKKSPDNLYLMHIKSNQSAYDEWITKHNHMIQTLVDNNIQLVIFDKTDVSKYANFTTKAKRNGVTVILHERVHTDIDTELILQIEKSNGTNIILTTQHKKSNKENPIAYCKVIETADEIKLLPLPWTEEPLTKIEEEVWCALQQLGPSSMKNIKSEITKSKSKADFIPNVLDELKEKNLVICENQKGRMGNTRIWSTVIPK